MMGPKVWKLKGFGRDKKAQKILNLVLKNDVKTLRYLLQNDAQTLSQSSVLDQSLLKAVKQQSIDIILLLLEAGVDPNRFTVNNKTKMKTPILIHAVMDGNPDVLEAILNHSPNLDVNVRYDGGNTPLHIATEKGYEDCAMILLKAGANPLLRNQWRESPLTIAVSSNLREAVRMMVFYSPEAIKHRDIEGRSLLHIASKHGYEDLVKHFLRIGCNPNMVDQYGNTPLIDAIFRGNVIIVEILAKCEKTINFQSDATSPPIIYAAQIKIINCIEILLNNGASVNAQDKLGNSALILSGPYIGHVKLLLWAGVDPNLQNRHGMTALWYAAFNQYAEVVNVLLRANSQVDIKAKENNQFHTTPVEIAMKRGHYEIARNIILAGACTHKLRAFIQNCSLPFAIRHNLQVQKMMCWIQSWIQNPPKLKHLSRIKIRGHLGTVSTEERIFKLPLPPILKEFVNFSEF